MLSKVRKCGTQFENSFLRDKGLYKIVNILRSAFTKLSVTPHFASLFALSKRLYALFVGFVELLSNFGDQIVGVHVAAFKYRKTTSVPFISIGKEPK